MIETTRPPERPLSRRAFGYLVASATIVVLVFYLYCALALVGIGIALAVEIIGLVFLARFGLLYVMVRAIQPLFRIGGAVLRSLNLRPGVELSVPLTGEDAPLFFEMLDDTARRLGTTVPARVVVGVGVNASVRLRGVRAKSGRSELTVGDDLFAILSVDEMRAVIAHELAHAKLIQRGYKGWLTGGVGRMWRLSATLQAAKVAAYQQRKVNAAAALIYPGAYALAKAGLQLAATYSRQDEFEADRAAVTLCAAAIYRATLTRTILAGIKGNTIPWRERVAQSEREESFHDWLRSRLLPADDAERTRLEQEALTRVIPAEFNTHPTLADRLAALPEDASAGSVPASEPATTLLRAPEEFARRVVRELEAIAKAAEQKESERLHRLFRKSHRAKGSIHPRPRESNPLPVPTVTAWEDAMKLVELRCTDPVQWWPSIEKELRVEAPTRFTSRSERKQYWSRRACDALARCDYQRAAVAAILGVQKELNRRLWFADAIDRRDIPVLYGLLAYGVSSAYFGKVKEMNKSLGKALKESGLGPSVSWAAGWALTMLNDYRGAEPYLSETVEKRPTEVLPWVLLGVSRQRVGKLRESTESFQQAVTLEPENPRIRILLTHMLLMTGRGRAAMDQLENLNQKCPTDLEVMLLRVGAHVLLGQTDEISRARISLEAAHPGVATSLRLGHFFAELKYDRNAAACFDAVTAQGFYPEALVARGFVDLRAKDFAAARPRLLSALDTTRALGPQARGPLEFFGDVCRGLMAMEAPVAEPIAWSVTVNLSGAMPKYSRTVLLVHAANVEQAEACLRTLYEATLPGRFFKDAKARWVSARRPPQAGPPGVYQYRFER